MARFEVTGLVPVDIVVEALDEATAIKAWSGVLRMATSQTSGACAGPGWRIEMASFDHPGEDCLHVQPAFDADAEEKGESEMTEQIAFMAPDATEVRLLQAAEGGWSVTWDDPDNAERVDYSADGPTADWESVDLNVGRPDRELVWLDEQGAIWLTRHLIPASAVALDSAAVALAQRDTFAAKAADHAHRMVLELETAAELMPEGPSGAGPVERVIRAAKDLRDICYVQSEQLARAWATMLASERAAGRGLAAPGPCDLCVGECRGHGLGRAEQWEPEPGSRADLQKEKGEPN